MASGSITSWQIDVEKVEEVPDFIFLGSKISVNGDCSHEIKRHSLLGKKGMTSLDSILKNRDIGAPPKESLLCFHCFPYLFDTSDGTRCHDLSFLNVEF